MFGACSRHRVGQQTATPGRPAPRESPAVNHGVVTSLELFQMRTLRRRWPCGPVIHGHAGRVRYPCWRRVPYHGPIPSSAGLTTTALQYERTSWTYVYLNTSKIVPYWTMSVGHGADPGFLTVSPQVTLVINPVLGCCYFPPGLRLLSQPKRSATPWPVPNYTAW